MRQKKAIKPGSLFAAMSEIKEEYIAQAAGRRKRRLPLYGGIAAACLAVAVGVGMLSAALLHGDGNPAGLSVVQPAPSVPSSSVGGVYTVPVWYAPGELTAMALTYPQDKLVLTQGGRAAPEKLGAAPGGTHIRVQAQGTAQAEFPLRSDTRILDCYNAVWLKLDPATAEGHGSGCSGVFYNAETGEILCLSERIQEKFGPSLGAADSLNVYAVSPAVDRCLFSTTVDGAYGADYCYDLQTDRLILLPSVVSHTETQAALVLRYADDLRTVAALDPGDADRPAALYLVHIDEEAVVEHIYDFPAEYVEPYKRLVFSPGGRYLAYYPTTTQDSYLNVGTKAGRWRMRDLETGREWEGAGKIARFTEGDAAVVVQTETGVQVLDTATGETAPEGTAEAWQLLDIQAADYGTSFTGPSYTITAVPLSGEGEPEVLRENVGAYCAADGYLYTYSQGEGQVECLSLSTGESFAVPVDEGYVEQTASLPENILAVHRLYRSNDGTRLLLQYTTAVQDPDAERAWYMQQYDLPDIERLYDTYSSLSEMEAYFRDGLNPPDPAWGAGLQLSYFSGQGYACVVMKQWGNAYLFMDDYRDGTFSIYVRYGGEPAYWLDRAGGDPGKYFRKALSPQAEEADGIPLYTSLPAYSDPLDLAEYYTDGEFDGGKMERRQLDYTLIQANTAQASIGDREAAGAGNTMYPKIFKDLSPLEEMLEIAVSKPYIGWNSLQSEQETAGCTIQYEIDLRNDEFKKVLEYWVGRLADGRGMVKFGGYYRALDDAEYARLLELCREIYEGGSGWW
ncbi:MAG TPA: hypothetical protein H9694_09050 [Firmicutes bacterium]|nr:hypothetical protein [Bacillota bacterium]